MEPELGRVKPRDAIDFFRQKVDLPTEAWTDLWQGQHARAFVVAGATRDSMLVDFHEAIDRALDEGLTLDDFRKDFDDIVRRYGWSYNGSRSWRSAVIFNTNIRMANAAGAWKKIERLSTRRPFLRYIAVLDDRTRDLHRAWHNTVLPWDDEFWEYAYPPNGWNCRCSVIQLSQRDIDRLLEKGVELKFTRPEVPKTSRDINTPAGPRTVEGRQGIDTGFDYNVGIAAWGTKKHQDVILEHNGFVDFNPPAGNIPNRVEPLQVVEPLGRLGQRLSNIDVTDQDAELRKLFRDAFGGDERIFTDPAGDRVAITQGLVDHMLDSPSRIDGREALWPLIPELIEQPQEIWAGFATDPETKRVHLRRRYVKLLQLDRKRAIGLIADVQDGYYQAVTFFRGKQNALPRLRRGLRVFKSDSI